MTATSAARPLAGRRVLVTRPRNQAQELVTYLESLGARVLVAPTIRVDPPEDPAPLLDAARDPARFDWIVFSSTNAVDAFFDAVAQVHATGERRGAIAPRMCAVGSRTAARLRERGASDVLTPADFKADGVVSALMSTAPMHGARVLLPRSEIGRETIADALRTAGAVVTDVIAYRTVAETIDADAVDVGALLRDRELDAVTFTSGSTVRNFVHLYGPETARLLVNTVVAVIGPVTADAARELGIPVHVQPATYTTDAMVDALVAHLGAA